MSMEFLVALSIGVMTAGGVYLVLRQRTFPAILGIALLSYAVNVFLFASGRLTVGGATTQLRGRSRALWCVHQP